MDLTHEANPKSCIMFPKDPKSRFRNRSEIGRSSRGPDLRASPEEKTCKPHQGPALRHPHTPLPYTHARSKYNCNLSGLMTLTCMQHHVTGVVAYGISMHFNKTSMKPETLRARIGERSSWDDSVNGMLLRLTRRITWLSLCRIEWRSHR